MTKLDFLLTLNQKLSALPQDDLRERINFYCEMIEDRMEEGLSEEAAVAAVGNIDDIAAQITEEVTLASNLCQKKQKKKIKVWEIILLAVGSPLWLSLGLAAFAVCLALYVVLWAVIISLWAAFVAVGASSFCGIVVGGAFMFGKKVFSGFALIALGLVCFGLTILLFYLCKLATKGAWLLTKKPFSIFHKKAKKEAVQ